MIHFKEITKKEKIKLRSPGMIIIIIIHIFDGNSTLLYFVLLEHFVDNISMASEFKYFHIYKMFTQPLNIVCRIQKKKTLHIILN